MKTNTLALIENLKKDTSFNNISVHLGDTRYWDYFFIIRGYHGSKYFYLQISKLKESESAIIDLSDISECKEEIINKLKEFEIKN